jgi:hypothetical protein
MAGWTGERSCDGTVLDEYYEGVKVKCDVEVVRSIRLLKRKLTRTSSRRLSR